MRRKFDNVLALPGFDMPTVSAITAGPVPAILRGATDLPADTRPAVEDMTAAELRAELAAHGHDEDAIDRLPNWTALAGAVRKIRRP